MLCAICVPLLLCYDVVMIVVVFGCYSSTLEYAARIPTGHQCLRLIFGFYFPAQCCN